MLFPKNIAVKSFFLFAPTHSLAESKGLYLKDLDGENMLLRSEIGFWKDLILEKMPRAHFFVQKDNLAFSEIVKLSSLP